MAVIRRIDDPYLSLFAVCSLLFQAQFIMRWLGNFNIFTDAITKKLRKAKMHYKCQA